MFSVNNFYNYFAAEYGFEKTKNFIVTFLPHGSKDLHRLESFGFNSSNINNFYRDVYCVNPKIIMHDQEPISLAYWNIYKDTLVAQQNKVEHLKYSNHRSDRLYRRLTNFQGNNLTEFIKLAISSQHHNIKEIICHSEKNSSDVNHLRNNGFIDCYYWWHGMIARDWFRHWQHYSDLLPYNKSKCQHKFLLYSRDMSGTRKYRSAVILYLKKFQDIVRYAWNGSCVDSSYSAKIDIDDAKNSAIHLVAETLFDTDKIYLTEKVFKPMVMSQPFILFAPPGSLQYLRDYGFQTFSNCWDESYDQETDSKKRMISIFSLINSLASKSDDEFFKIYQECLPIIEHNRARFYSQDFQDMLLSEFHANMSVALAEQNHCVTPFLKHVHSS
jgi:hypothetical protein